VGPKKKKTAQEGSFEKGGRAVRKRTKQRMANDALTLRSISGLGKKGKTVMNREENGHIGLKWEVEARELDKWFYTRGI